MLDLAGIMFTTIMILMVVVRAVRMDREQPWFAQYRRKPLEVAATAPMVKPWRRRT